MGEIIHLNEEEVKSQLSEMVRETVEKTLNQLLDRIDYEQRLNLLYVGMTRARSVLYMLVSDKALKTIDRRIREGSVNAI